MAANPPGARGSERGAVVEERRGSASTSRARAGAEAERAAIPSLLSGSTSWKEADKAVVEVRAKVQQYFAPSSHSKFIRPHIPDEDRLGEDLMREIPEGVAGLIALAGKGGAGKLQARLSKAIHRATWLRLFNNVAPHQLRPVLVSLRSSEASAHLQCAPFDSHFAHG